MRVPVAALTHFNHHHGRICKHVRCLKQKLKSGLQNFKTASLSTICVCCNKDTDTWFAPTISQLVLLSTKYFIV